MYFTTEPGQRREFIGALRELAAFIDGNPAIPVPLYSTPIELHTTGSDAEKFDAVDRIAGLLGVPPKRGGHYTAARRFGPIEYEVSAIPSAWRAEHDARRSYDDNITIPNAGPAPAA